MIKTEVEYDSMSDKNKHIGLLCTEETLCKLKYIAEYDGRSLNGELIHLINSAIRQFERNNGVIITNPNGEKYEIKA